MMKYMCIKTFTVYGLKYPVLCLLKLVQSLSSGELERPEFDYYDLYGNCSCLAVAITEFFFSTKDYNYILCTCIWKCDAANSSAGADVFGNQFFV